jgi:hypothetical protein
MQQIIFRKLMLIKGHVTSRIEVIGKIFQFYEESFQKYKV